MVLEIFRLLGYANEYNDHQRRARGFYSFLEIRYIFEFIQQNHVKLCTLRHFVKLNIIISIPVLCTRRMTTLSYVQNTNRLFCQISATVLQYGMTEIILALTNCIKCKNEQPAGS